MGLMKEFLMEKTHELAGKLGIEEAQFYDNPLLKQMAMDYANYQLHLEYKEKDTREEIKKAILTRTDEVIDLIQELLSDHCAQMNSCKGCDYSFLCEASTQYKGGKE